MRPFTLLAPRKERPKKRERGRERERDGDREREAEREREREMPKSTCGHLLFLPPGEKGRESG